MAAKKQTLAEQKEFFEKNGYLIVKDMLSPSQLAELRTRVDEALAGTKPQFGDFELQWEPQLLNRTDLPRAQRIRVFFHLCHRDGWFHQYATRPEVVEIISTLLGPNPRLYTDQLFVKGPYNGSAVPWHQDAAYWPVEPMNMISCWMAIDDATVENGCVYVIPGTHKKPIPHTHFKTGPQSLGLLEHEVSGQDGIPIELSAGSCMFHHSLLIHQSKSNTSPKPRRGLVTIYMPNQFTRTKPWEFKYGFEVLETKSELALQNG
jgi:phytanoyl-CoA hydroxylase